MPIEATVCLIRQDGKLLLQKKASERFGGGKWDGPGGKLRPGESPAEGVVREVEEETGLTVIAPTFHGRPAVLAGHSFQATLWFDERAEQLLDYSVLLK